jgi:hypothetical protein
MLLIMYSRELQSQKQKANLALNTTQVVAQSKTYSYKMASHLLVHTITVSIKMELTQA